MTRPQIIRADTLDLQDKSSPTAQDHSLQPQHPAPLGIGPAAPHQQAAIRQVEEERSEEEARLQNAWSHAGDALREDPGSDDERTVVNSNSNSATASANKTRLQQDEQAIRLNGGLSGDHDDADMQDADVEEDMDDDDDMMDKISSSPSIDDGTAIRLQAEAKTDPEVFVSPRTKRLQEVERRLENSREDSHTSIWSDLNEETTNTILQPIHRFLNATPEDPFAANNTSPRKWNVTPPPTARHPDDDGDEDGSWTTDSDADSWNDEDLDTNDALDDISFSNDSRFIDSGWGGECLRETEDIDFEFVYALHTFVATVEGQANATKGDTMVLLDDSNSYWWLVRVVKDSSIGYLPAEHIETPTERLARLNKHRNIDLSATMLGDTAEKSKNPLKKAMRRRNAKTVQFAPPTYVEASDYDYSSDEGDGELFGGPEPKQVQQQDAQQQAQQQQTTQKSEAEQEDGLKVQPLKLGSGKKDANAQEDDSRASEDSAKREDVQRGSEEIFDRPMDPKVSRNGTLRNTDSFFKDENTETRKITLTPNLLRDDSSTSTTGSRERGPSLESLEKNGFADKAKDKKDKKEKKPGMLSGLFKRKDKKSKGMLDSVDSDIEKPEEADRSSPQSKPSEDSAERPSTEQSLATPQRQPSKGKLQKSQRTRDDSPQKTKGILKTSSPTEATMQSESNSNTPTDKPIAQQTTSTLRMIQPESESSWTTSVEERGPAPGSNNPFTKAMKAEQSEAKPEAVKQSKERVQLDDFDSDEGSDPFADPDAQAASTRLEASQSVSRLSESPVHVSAADAQPSKLNIQDRDKENDQHLPGLTTDSSSQETSSPISTPTPEDSPMKTIPENSQLSSFRSGATPSPTNLSNSNTIPPPSRPAPVPNKEREPSPPISPDSMLPAWSDASLRAYLDDGSEIRDMLLVVNDTTGVVPVGKDHPFMKDLFVEESKTVQGLSGELDRLLNALVEKRMRRAGSTASKASTTRSIDETARGVGGR